MKTKQSIVLILLILFLSLSGCSVKEEIPKQEEQLHEEEAQQEDVPADPVDPVVDIDGTYLSDEDCLVCFIEGGIRERKSPNGEIITTSFGKETKTKHIERGCYLILDQEDANGYTWYKIGEDRWVGTKPEWIELHTVNDNLNSFDPEFEEYLSSKQHITDGAHIFEDYDTVGKWLNMNDEEVEILKFLKYVLPIGSAMFNYDQPFDWDSRNPSNEVKRWMYTHIFYASAFNAWMYDKRFDERVYDIYLDDVLADGGLESYLYVTGFASEEVINTYTNKYYGNPIDFRPASVGNYHVLYDAITRTYIHSDPTGVGDSYSMIYITNLEKENEYIFLDAAVFRMASAAVASDYSKGSIDKSSFEYGYGIMGFNDGMFAIKDEDRFDYLENKAQKIKIVLRKTTNDYQLITVKVL